MGVASQSPGAAQGAEVVVLSGGTGGAKLARGMLDVVGPERLTVIANTGDDIEIYGAHVSPDPDLVCFWLADAIDARGWGLKEDTFMVMDALRDLSVDVWFNLGDRDLAWCLRRAELEAQGLRPTEALRALCEELKVKARVLPMCDMPQRTFVNGVSLQEFLIAHQSEGPVREVRFESEQPVEPSPEVRSALARARTVVIGPSNPVISIWPILTALGDAIELIEGKVVCVSPVVGGEIVKGPTAAFLDAYGQPLSADGVLGFYESVCPGLLDGMVADEPLEGGLPHLCTSTLLSNPDERAVVAQRTLSFAESLQDRRGRTRGPAS